MAICLSGDFDPDRMIATIDKYFGGLKPNPELPEWSFTPEPAMTAPVEKTVLGQEAEMVYLGWRTGGASSEDADMIQLVSSLLSNGKCGLLDVDIQQQQKNAGRGCGGPPIGRLRHDGGHRLSQAGADARRGARHAAR